jgi:hypothetical protein
MSNIKKIALEIKVAGDNIEEGKWALYHIVSKMHTLGIYETAANVSDNDIEKINKYDKETGTKLTKVRNLIKKEIEPLVVDLNLWFKEFDKK